MKSLFITAAPLLLAATGALFSELAGVLAIFIDGVMTASSFFSWVIAMKTGSVILAMTLSACVAALSGWALARFVRKTGANPFIAGLALNVAAGGICEALSTLWFGTKGVLRNTSAVLPDPVNFVGLSLIGIVIAALYLWKTPWGLRLRASGLAPHAARERGLRPGLYWEFSWAAAALFAALSGAVLTFRIGAYTPGGVAGRGWISLAAVYLGFRSPPGIVIAALVFAMAERLALNLQAFRFLPATALIGLPQALALVLYAVSHFVKKRKKTEG